MRAFLADLSVLLDRADRRRMLAILACLVLIGAIDAASIGSILPFLAVAGEPGLIHSHRLLSAAYAGLGLESERQFVLLLGAASFVLVTLGNLLNAGAGWMLSRFAASKGHAMAAALMGRYLERPYEFYFNRNASDLITNLFLEIRRVTVGVLQPLLLAFSRIVLVLAIVALIVAVDVTIAVSVSAALGLIYGLLYRVQRRTFWQLGKRASDDDAVRMRFATEALAAIKEVKVFGAQRYFAERFARASRDLARYESTLHALSQTPRHAIEAIAFGGVVLIVLMLTREPERARTALPVIAVLTFAGYRLLPALQQLFSGAATIMFHLPSLRRVADEMREARAPRDDQAAAGPGAALDWRTVAFRDVTVAYPGRASPALERVNATLERNTTIGVVGTTGAGKSTLIDVLLGLVTPTSGAIEVDGRPLREVGAAWLRAVGYVPQHPVLLDASIAQNIAFGEEAEAIVEAQVRKAAHLANLARFIETELPQGYATLVGERGIRLSGGQRQRLALARALYRGPRLILLDEATSALDVETERQIIDTVRQLSGEATVVVVTHRLSALRSFERILLLDQGRCIAAGGFDELFAGHGQFRALAAEAGR